MSTEADETELRRQYGMAQKKYYEYLIKTHATAFNDYLASVGRKHYRIKYLWAETFMHNFAGGSFSPLADARPFSADARRLYRCLCLIYHPDKGVAKDDSAIKRVNELYAAGDIDGLQAMLNAAKGEEGSKQGEESSKKDDAAAAAAAAATGNSYAEQLSQHPIVVWKTQANWKMLIELTYLTDTELAKILMEQGVSTARRLILWESMLESASN